MLVPGASICTRFAPSPTGHLHLGHLVNAIYVWGLGSALGADVLLRLEDHDGGRCRSEYADAIIDDLEWLGLLGSVVPVARQSERGVRYDAVLANLANEGRVYTCTCSRKMVLQRSGTQDGALVYDNHCRDNGFRPDLEGGTRIILAPEPQQFQDLNLGPQLQTPATQCGDMLVKDRHGNWTYQFAVTVDDWDQGVDVVIRGEDLLDSTGRQIQLARILGRETPPRFLHHPLIADAEGNKLSKRDFARGLCDYRAAGWTPEQILGQAAWRVGLIAENAPLDASGLNGLFSGSAFAGAIQAQ